MPTPAVVSLNGIELHCGLSTSGPRVRLECDPLEWPGYRLGTRVKLHRGHGDEWFTVEGVLRVAELLVVVLTPTEPPPVPKMYWPPATGAVGS